MKSNILKLSQKRDFLKIVIFEWVQKTTFLISNLDDKT
jgi:hypothetical protein